MRKILFTIALCLSITIVVPCVTHAIGTINKSISAPSNALGLVGWWTMDGKDTPWTTSTAATTLDKSGSGNTGTLTNMAQATSPVIGKIGQALNFDGDNDFITTGSDSLGMSALSVSAWIYPVGYGESNAGVIVGNGSSVLNIAGDANRLRWTNNSVNQGASANDSVLLNRWTHVAITRTAAGIVNFYINGTQSGSVDQVTGVVGSLTAGTENTGIGNRSLNGGDRAFNGKIDDLRVYNRTLSSSEIAQLYNVSASKFDVSPTNALLDSLAGYWTFDGKDTPWTSSTDATTLDKSGNGITGTLTNMAQATSPVAGKIGQGLNFDGVDDAVLLAGVGSASVSFLQPASSTSSLSEYTFSNQSLGDAASDRCIIITVHGRDTGAVAKTLNSVTIGGVSANIAVQRQKALTNSTIAAIVEATVPTGTTGDVVVTWSEAMLRMGVAMYRATGANCSAYDTGSDIDAGPSDTLSTVAGGFAIGGAATGAVTTTTWTNLTEDWDQQVNFSTMSAAHDETVGTPLTVTATFAADTDTVAAFASFEPEGGGDFIGTGADSISAWIKPRSFQLTGADRHIVGNGKTILTMSGSVSSVAFTSDDSTLLIAASNAMILNQWNHVVATRDASGNAVIYVNGALSNSGTSGTPTDGTTAVHIGNNSILTSVPFDGSIDNVRIYNRVLSGGEVTQLYDMGR